MKSILFLINTLDVGGAGKILRFVAETCENVGYNVKIVTMFDSAKDIDRLAVKNECIGLGIERTSYMWRISMLHSIRKIVKRERPDIVCAFISDVAFMSRLATLGLNINFISAERGDPYTLPEKWRLPVKWAYNNSDYCVFQLDGARDFFGKKVLNKSAVIPNPFATSEVVNPYNGIRKKTIVSVGRFEYQKGYDILIRAFAEFVKSFTEYRLILYGDGSLRSELEQLVTNLGINDKVDMPGYIRNVSEVIREDGVFVLSSRFEGIPNSLIEAMVLGIPTISTDCTPGGPRFLTDNGRRGLLVPVDNVKSMTKAMEQVVINNVLNRRLSESGREIVDILNADNIRQQWISVFEVV